MDKSNNEARIISLNANYQGSAPWNIGRPQPALEKLFDKYPLNGPVLDAGCGAGDLAISIANRGLPVLGMDLSDKAIDICKSKKASLKPEVQTLLEFRVGDVLKPSHLNRQFGSIVDSGFYHLFGQIERDGLAKEFLNSLAKGGRYYLLGFAIAPPLPHAPKQVTPMEIEKRFSQENGWKILELGQDEFITALPPPRGRIPAICACMENAGK